MPEQGSSINFQEILLTRERELLLWAIEQAAGIHVEAAILLGMSYRSFRHYLRKHRLGSRGSIEWVNAHAQETKAVALLNRAIAEGSIKRPSQCSACGSTRRIEGHHTDYNKPLEVVWLCPSCHKLEHAKIAQKRRIVTRSAHGV